MVLCKPIPTGRQHRMHLFSLRGSARTGRGPHAPAATPAVATEQRDTQTDPRILVKTRKKRDESALLLTLLVLAPYLSARAALDTSRKRMERQVPGRSRSLSRLPGFGYRNRGLAASKASRDW